MILQALKFIKNTPASKLLRLKQNLRYYKNRSKSILYILSESLKYQLSTDTDKESPFDIYTYAISAAPNGDHTLNQSMPRHWDLEIEYYDIEIRTRFNEDQSNLEEIICLEIDELTQSKCERITKYLALITGADIEHM